MGVRGLQTFVRENRGSLCRSVLLPETSEQEVERGHMPIIVDAWGVIFQLYQDSLPWTSGGEYLRFYQLTKALVNAWRRVGLEPTFVFDGAAPSEKHATILKRMAEVLPNSQLFFNTSKESRSASSFGRNSSVRAILPAFASHSFIFALHRLGVATHHVPTGEADGVCVMMADRVGGYVLGKDTDFVILVGRAERTRGYVPLDMMMWIEGAQEDGGEEGEDDGWEKRSAPASFQTVQNRRNKSHSPRQTSLLPSPAHRHPTLVLTVIPPQALRQRLRLPANCMPLFASLVGTDYTPPAAHNQFFEASLDACQRIEKAARVLREQLFSPSANNAKKNADPGDFVVELVRRVVKKLCIYPFDTDQALLAMVNDIIEAALQYSLPNGGECCTSYPFCGELDPLGCRTPGTVSGVSTPAGDGHALGEALPSRTAVEAYAAAQRQGSLTAVTHGWLYPNRIYLRGLLEDPRLPSLRLSEGSRAIRRATFVIADEGLGSLRFVSGPTPAQAKKEDKALRGLLGVDVSASCSEVEFSGEDGKMIVVDGEAGEPVQSSRVLVEWARVGSAVVPLDLRLPPKRDLELGETPLCIAPLDERLRAFLSHMHSDTPAIRALPPSLQALVALVRFCVVEAPGRGGRPDAAKWRRDEAAAVLKGGLGTFAMWRRELEGETAGRAHGHKRVKKVAASRPEEDARAWPTLETRNAHIVSQFASAMVDSVGLAEALLLLPSQVAWTASVDPQLRTEPGSSASPETYGPTHLSPFVFFSGIVLHTLLLREEPFTAFGWRWGPEEEATLQVCWDALVADLADGTIIDLHTSKPGEAVPVPSAKKKAPESPNDDTGERKKSKGKSKGKKGGAAEKKMVGRFDLLEDLTI
ncbi:hypothetical protein IAT38_003913 [Cryptococcus sp. DSM 104549]